MDIVENQLYEKDAEIARLKAEVEDAGQAHLKMVTMYEKEISIFQDAIKRHQGENADLRKEVERLTHLAYGPKDKNNETLRSRLEKAEAGMHDKCSCVGCSLQYTAECVPYSKLLTAEARVRELEEKPHVQMADEYDRMRRRIKELEVDAIEREECLYPDEEEMIMLKERIAAMKKAGDVMWTWFTDDQDCLCGPEANCGRCDVKRDWDKAVSGL